MPTTKDFKLEELSKYFHLPEKAVAKELGICLTSLKKICRSYGVTRARACARRQHARQACDLRKSAAEHGRYSATEVHRGHAGCGRPNADAPAACVLWAPVAPGPKCSLVRRTLAPLQ